MVQTEQTGHFTHTVGQLIRSIDEYPRCVIGYLQRSIRSFFSRISRFILTCVASRPSLLLSKSHCLSHQSLLLFIVLPVTSHQFTSSHLLLTTYHRSSRCSFPSLHIVHTRRRSSESRRDYCQSKELASTECIHSISAEPVSHCAQFG